MRVELNNSKVVVLAGFMVLSIAFLPYINAQELRSGVEYNHEWFNKVESDIKLVAVNNLETSQGILNGSFLQTGLAYNIIKPLTVSGAFRYIAERNTENKEQGNNIESKYRITADLSIKSKRFSNDTRLSNRTRFQYNIDADGIVEKELRNRLKLSYKFNKNMQPYIAIEPYYGLSDSEIEKIRFYLGSEIELFKNEISVFTIIEIKESRGDVSTHQILGLIYQF